MGAILMTRGHCHDWFRKWKREHNFCGLRPQDANEMDRYIELTEKIAPAVGKDEDFIHDHFTAGAARPLLRCKDERAYEKALNYVVSCLKREEDITGGDLQATIDGFTGKQKKEKPAGSTHLPTETPEVPVEESTHLRTDTGPETLADRLKSEPHGQNPDHRIVDANKTMPAAVKPDLTTEVLGPASTSPFKTARQVRDGVAGEMFSQEDPTPLPPLPPNASMSDRLKRDEEILARTQGIPRRTTKSPNEFTIITSDAQRDILRQAVRSGLAESMEEAILLAVDKMGEGINV